MLTSRELTILTKIVHNILFQKHPKLNELIKYLMDMVKLLADLNLPIAWLTPSGLYINQAYKKKMKVKVTNTFNRKKFITLAIPTNILDQQKQIRGIVPNLVHSLDASILAFTINIFFKRQLISNIYTIHDCFASTATNIPLMTDFIREAFIELYSHETYIDNLHQFLMQYISNNYVIDKDGEIEILNNDNKTYYKIPKKPHVKALDPYIIKKALYLIH